MTNKKINILLSLLFVCLMISSCNDLSKPDNELTEKEQIIAAIKAGGDVILPENVSADTCRILVYLIKEAKPYQRPIISIKLPVGLGFMGGYNIDTLVNFYVSENDTRYISVDGVIYTKDKSRLVHFPIGRTGEFTIPNTTKHLYNGAF